MGGVGPPAGPLFILSETRCCGRSLVSPTRETCVLGPAGSSLGGWGAARGPGLGAVRELTWAAQAGAVGDSRDAEAVAGGEAAAVQDGRPGVAVAGHDGRTAGLHGLTQAAARVDDPAGGGGGWKERGEGAVRTLLPGLRAGPPSIPPLPLSLRPPPPAAPSTEHSEGLRGCWATTPGHLATALSRACRACVLQPPPSSRGPGCFPAFQRTSPSSWGERPVPRRGVYTKGLALWAFTPHLGGRKQGPPSCPERPAGDCRFWPGLGWQRAEAGSLDFERTHSWCHWHGHPEVLARSFSLQRRNSRSCFSRGRLGWGRGLSLAISGLREKALD